MDKEETTLYFKSGNSDKVYVASIEESGDGVVVNYAYGRTGSTLKTGTKTTKPVNEKSARKIYDKIIKEKTSKGYTYGEDGTPYTTGDNNDTGIRCQLLNMVEEEVALGLIKNPAYWAQEKFDGKRMLIMKEGDKVTAINRKGLAVGAPQSIIDCALDSGRDFIIDGEAIGDRLNSFDALELAGDDMKSAPYAIRLKSLELINFPFDAINVIYTAKTTAEKRKLFNLLKKDSEGIVFKDFSAPYTASRPNSGGPQLKFKFYNTATVLVLDINLKRSIVMGILSEGNFYWLPVGNVTIPPNKEIPHVNSVIEVRYLYAYPGGSLYQPVYLSERDDMDIDACQVSQLKYKKVV